MEFSETCKFFGIVCCSAGASLMAYKYFARPKSTSELSEKSVPFSSFWSLISSSSSGNFLSHVTFDGGMTGGGGTGDSPALVTYRLSSHPNMEFSTELIPGSVSLVTEKLLDLQKSRQFTILSNSAEMQTRLKALMVIGEIVGWASAIGGVLFMYRLLKMNNDFSKSSRATDEDFGQLKKFEDIAGLDRVKTELKEIVDFLSSPETFSALGAKPPRGVLLEGPSGTGKTLIGKAVAGEASVPFFYCAASQFVEVFVGQGARRIREIFECAKKEAPCVLFIDELDAIGMRRVGGAASQEYVQTINQLLVELDGMTSNNLVVVLAATNRFDTLDDALTRAGRFDRIVHVGYPDKVARMHAFQIHSRNLVIAADVDFGSLAQDSDGWTGADIESVMNEAALVAARRNLKCVPHEVIVEVIGDRKLDDRERRNRCKDREFEDIDPMRQALLEILKRAGNGESFGVTAAD